MANTVEQARVKLGRLLTVWNSKKRKNEKVGYTAVWVEDADGRNERCLLFTERELQKAEKRAEKNKEDIPQRSTLTMLLD